MRRRKSIPWLALVFFGLIGAVSGVSAVRAEGEGSMVDYLNDPAFPQAYWMTAKPETVGLDENLLKQALVRIKEMNYEIHSMLVVKDGKLVFEVYGRDRAMPNVHQMLPDELHPLHSTTKSVTSALIGIALNQGLIKSVQEPVLPYFKDLKLQNVTPDKRRMTIEDVLTMRSGLDWSDEMDEWALWQLGNPVEYVLSQPMAAAPGTVWNYSTGNSHILASILARVAGQSPAKYAEKNLFGPLGITHYRWDANRNNVNQGGMWLYLKPRDMAKFGLLYLQKGRWEGQQVVPGEWVETSVRKHSATYWGGDYGYHWWIRGGDCFAAQGAYGQDILVFPNQDTVVVFTAKLPIEQADAILEGLARQYVIAGIH